MKIDRKAIAAAVVLAFLSTSCVLSGSALAGFTASVANTGSTAGSGTDFLTAKSGTTTQCTSVPSGSTVPATTSFPCTGNQFPATVPTTGSSTGVEALTASGTSSFSSATYRAVSCGPVQLANTATASDPMVVRGGVTFAGAGPTTLTGSASFGVDGSTGMAVDVASANGLQTFSEAIWFKTSAAQGTIMGYSSSPSNTSASTFDRHIYFNAAGNVVFGLYNGGALTVQSTAALNNGAWHFVVATLASNTGTLNLQSIQTLYIDGVQAATTTRTNGNGAESSTGYWRIGESRSSTGDGWTGNGQFFSGALSNAMVFPTALTAGQVSALFAATSQSGLATLIAADGALHYWPLNDNGLQTFAGPYPVLNATSPCAQVGVTVGTATKCVYPASTTACASATTANLLSALVAAGSLSLSPSTVAVPQTLTTTLSEGSTYNTGYDQGLHLLVPVTITETPFTQAVSWSTNAVIV